MRHVAAVLGLLIASSRFGASQAIQITAAARSMQPGELVVLTIAVPTGVKDVQVRAFNRDIRAFSDGPLTWRALVGIDLDVRPGAHVVSVDAPSVDARATGVNSVGRVPSDVERVLSDPPVGLHATYELKVLPKKFATRTLTVDEAFVNPPAAMQARIEREAAELQKVWKASAPTRLWTEPFVRPVPGTAVSRFGTRSIFNGASRNPHSGADFMSPAGTPIHAPNAGRIVIARELYFSGNTVVIDHGLGLFSLLAHLSAIDVRDGDQVTGDQVVGRVGATGRVTGAHLHWAVRATDARVDPLSLLALLGQTK